MGSAPERAKYRFDSQWWLDVPTTVVFDAVVDLASYPRWWPEVRAVRQIDDDTAELSIRALLPYALTVRMHRRVQDLAAGVVEVAISGDLEGSLRGDLLASAGGTTLRIRQEVVLCRPLLRRFENWARPLYRVNHTFMMRRGQRGLRYHLRTKDS